MSAPPDCIDCGACCFSTLPGYLRLDGDDHARLGDRADDLTHFLGNRCYMKLHDGHCAALVIDPAGRFVCSVYEQRPRTCRDLERGSPACQGERQSKGERPLLALAALRGPRPPA